MAFEKFQFPYVQERLVWDNSPSIVFAANTLWDFSLKIAALAGNENAGHLHEDVGFFFYFSDSDADEQVTVFKKVHKELKQNKNYNNEVK